MRKRNKVLLGCLATFLLLALMAYGWYRYRYPYGYTHCCTIAMWFDFRQYAEEHGGKFPAGEATPEASLSLLYRTVHTPDFFLAGRAKSWKAAKKILESGRLLGPDTCDWHYVEGLTVADDWRIAILWDKSSLGHTGQRLNGGHEVTRLDGCPEVISAEKWEAFLSEQRDLLARRSQQAKECRILLQAWIEMPDGTVVDHVNETCFFSSEFHSPTSTGNGTSSGGLGRDELTWYTPEVENGTSTYSLRFANLACDPVTVEWQNGLAHPDNIVFRMRPRDAKK